MTSTAITGIFTNPESDTAMTDTPTPEEQPKTEPYNDLHALADFIKDRKRNELDHSLWAHLMIVGDGHEAYSASCRYGHQFDDFPCDEFANALALGIGWLKARVEAIEQRPNS